MRTNRTLSWAENKVNFFDGKGSESTTESTEVVLDPPQSTKQVVKTNPKKNSTSVKRVKSELSSPVSTGLSKEVELCFSLKDSKCLTLYRTLLTQKVFQMKTW